MKSKEEIEAKYLDTLKDYFDERVYMGHPYHISGQVSSLAWVLGIELNNALLQKMGSEYALNFVDNRRDKLERMGLLGEDIPYEQYMEITRELDNELMEKIIEEAGVGLE